MSKVQNWGLAFLISSIVVVCSIYIFIPSPTKITRVRPVKCSPLALDRFLSQDKRFLNWWKNLKQVQLANSDPSDSIFLYKTIQFTVFKKIHPYQYLEIGMGHSSMGSTLLTIPITKDSCHLVWSTAIEKTQNPITRVRNYYNAIMLSSIMDSILVNLTAHLENSEALYGIPIQEISLIHDDFLASKFITKAQPDTPTLYAAIKALKSYASQQGAKIVDSPMLHIDQVSATEFEVMVGIPINKKIPDQFSIVMKSMPKGGKIIKGTVVGGLGAIRQGFKTVELYLSDIQRGSPAIPFQVLSTNRISEPDSSKWLTQIYYPVI